MQGSIGRIVLVEGELEKEERGKKEERRKKEKE